MNSKNIAFGIVLLLAVVVAGYFVLSPKNPGDTAPQDAVAQDTPDAPPAPAQGKINIDAVCQSALAYMSFPDAASADAFVAECKEGKHPDVIEQYKAQMNIDAGVAI